MVGVTGSIPVAPTSNFKELSQAIKWPATAKLPHSYLVGDGPRGTAVVFP